ncbi:TPA: hypothetical protein P0E36_004894 [Vibrio harveyi]|nr:hypothetical protein [Vibrio harveyi]
MKINTTKLLEIIKEDVESTLPHTIVGVSETYIGALNGSHITIKVYSHDDAEEEGILNLGTENFVIGDSGEDRIKKALKLLDMVETESAFNFLKPVMIGEQAITSTQLCHQCDDLDAPDWDCELCAGEGDYEETHVIDWTTQKETLSMAFVAMLKEAGSDE